MARWRHGTATDWPLLLLGLLSACCAAVLPLQLLRDMEESYQQRMAAAVQALERKQVAAVAGEPMSHC